MQYDIIAWQIEDVNIASAGSEAGWEFLKQFDPSCLPNIPSGQGQDHFLAFLTTIPTSLSVGVLDPTGKILNFRSRVLH